jgi:peptide/nickel transport system permease protein
MADSLPVFAIRRLFAAALLAVAVSALTFLTLHGLYPEAFNDTRPLFVELWHFLIATFVHFDLGQSQARPLGPVTELIGRGIVADFSLLLGALAFGVAAGTWAGAVCADHPGSWRARLLQLLGLLALCTPVYVIGMASILLFKPGISAPFPIGILPYHGYIPFTENPLKWLHSLVVPWIAAGAPLAAVCMRMTRASIAEIRGEDFIRTATAKGLSPGAVTARHVIPVALPPVISLAGAYTPLLIGHVILIEKVFDVPGVYQLIPQALDVGNYPIIQGLVIVTAVFVVIVNGIVDIVLAALDPRVRRM